MNRACVKQDLKHFALLSSTSLRQEQQLLFEQHTAVALPGNDAVAVGANRLQATDLRVPLTSEHELSLVRHFHSFYEPVDVFDSSWSLDLPRLNQRAGAPAQQPGMRRVYYELPSPLHSYSEVFAEVRPVPEVRGQLMVPTSMGEIFGLADSRELGFETYVLIFRMVAAGISTRPVT